MIGKSFASEVLFRELVTLDACTHGTVDHHDSFGHRGAQCGQSFGSIHDARIISAVATAADVTPRILQVAAVSSGLFIV